MRRLRGNFLFVFGDRDERIRRNSPRFTKSRAKIKREFEGFAARLRRIGLEPVAYVYDFPTEDAAREWMLIRKVPKDYDLALIATQLGHARFVKEVSCSSSTES